MAVQMAHIWVQTSIFVLHPSMCCLGFKLQSLIFVLHQTSPRLFMARNLELLLFVRGELYALPGSSKQPRSTEVKSSFVHLGPVVRQLLQGLSAVQLQEARPALFIRALAVHLCVMHQTSQTVSSVSFVLFT